MDILPEGSVDPVEVQIHQTMDWLIASLNQRRFYLLTLLREKRDETRSGQDTRVRMEQQLLRARSVLEQEITHNMLHSIQELVVRELEAGLAELRLNVANEIKFFCETRDLNDRISHLGEIGFDETPHIPLNPNYATFLHPVVAVGRKGPGLGEFNSASGVSVQESTGQIHVVDSKNRRIQIFSELGEHLTQFGSQLTAPWGILTRQDSVFVTDTEKNALFKFSFPDLILRTVVGKRGTGFDEFMTPRQLDISPNHLIHVADQDNNRVQIVDCDLVFRGSIQDPSMTSPVDVKFSANQMYVLSSWDRLCVHIFTLTGEKTRSIISKGVQVNSAFFFCLDRKNDIVINDRLANQVKVFSLNGDLLHTIGGEGHRPGRFYNNRGIAILKNAKLVCVSHNTNCALQIFST